MGGRSSLPPATGSRQPVGRSPGRIRARLVATAGRRRHDHDPPPSLALHAQLPPRPNGRPLFRRSIAVMLPCWRRNSDEQSPRASRSSGAIVAMGSILKTCCFAYGRHAVARPRGLIRHRRLCRRLRRQISRESKAGTALLLRRPFAGALAIWRRSSALCFAGWAQPAGPLSSRRIFFFAARPDRLGPFAFKWR